MLDCVQLITWILASIFFFPDFRLSLNPGTTSSSRISMAATINRCTAPNGSTPTTGMTKQLY